MARESDDSLRQIIERYTADRGSLQRFYDVAISPATEKTFRQFHTSWRQALDRIEFEKLGPNARVDWLLFRNTLDGEIRALDIERTRVDETSALLPFRATIIELKEARQRVDPLDPAVAAATLLRLNKQIDEMMRTIGKEPSEKVPKTVAVRASRLAETLRLTLKAWFDFYDGYDPVFSWWMDAPYKQVDANLKKYAAALREKLAGVKPDDRDTILGDPIGREALLADLRREMVPYGSEELIELANREFAWCDAEMLKASRESGFGDDWRRALEHVKTLHVPPGKQPALILEQALEAISKEPTT